MTTILDQSTPFEKISQQIGSAIQQPLQQGVQRGMERGQLQSALRNFQEVANNPNSNKDPFSLITSLMEAGAGIPGSEKYLGQLIPIALAQMQAKNSQNVDYNLKKPESIQDFLSENQKPQGQNLPNFMEKGQQQENPFYPNNIGQNNPPGNANQESTEGVKRKVFAPEEVIKEGKRIAREQSASGIPTTVPEGIEIAKLRNIENQDFNKQVEADIKARVASQNKYGNKAKEMLNKLFPDATDEQQAIFAKIGEDASRNSKSEADTERLLAKEATKFKNMISSVEKELSPSRSFNTLQKKLAGNYKEFNEAKQDLRQKIKPLLENGLYDTARKLLAKIGYYPEERESILGDLGEGSMKPLSQMPNLEPEHIKKSNNVFGPAELEFSQRQNQSIDDTLKKVFDNDANVNLLLLRKAFEDKGVDWRTFKNKLNELFENDESRKFNDDQRNQLQMLDSPPLNNLDKILHGLNLIGR